MRWDLGTLKFDGVGVVQWKQSLSPVSFEHDMNGEFVVALPQSIGTCLKATVAFGKKYECSDGKAWASVKHFHFA